MKARSCFRRRLAPLPPVIGALALALSIFSPFSPSAFAQIPAGGAVQAGGASIVSPDASSLVITQTTSAVTLHWDSFSIGAHSRVVIAQPSTSAVLLIRVTGSAPSEIFGRLEANGQVFLVNPNGVLFGRDTHVDLGGLVASTLDLPGPLDAAPGARRFATTGPGAAAGGEPGRTTGGEPGRTSRVVNAGSLTAAPGGYIALLGHEVVNAGSIEARFGTAALAAGDAVTLDFEAGGLLGVEIEASAPGALVASHGLVRADGGQALLSAGARDTLLASAVNHDGVIEARTLGGRAGRILLLAGMEAGLTTVAGVLDASAPAGGDGGFIETSAATVHVADSAEITTAAPAGINGTWLLDPSDFTIAPSGGNITGAALSAQLVTGNVSLTTDIGIGQLAEVGFINVNDAVSWSANTLTLTANRDININAVMTASGTASLEMTATFDTNSVNPGYVRVGYNPDGTFAGRVDFPGRTGTGFLTINGAGYTVINSLGAAGSVTGADLQGINGTNNIPYALGGDIDASATAGWNGGAGFSPLTTATGLRFNGLGHTISNLHITTPPTSDFNFGLFGILSAGSLVSNVGMVNASLTGGNRVGPLAGTNFGSIVNSWASGVVQDVTSQGGGLVGYNFGPAGAGGENSRNGLISRSHADTDVTLVPLGATAFSSAGGLVGFFQRGMISESWATGDVSGTQLVGGLVGNMGPIDTGSAIIVNSYATGNVTGTIVVGGLAGGMIVGGQVRGSYATGDVTGNQTYAAFFSEPGSYIGGLVGRMSAGLLGSNVSPPGVTVQLPSYATGNVTGVDYVGGAIGQAEALGNPDFSTIFSIYAEGGTVTGRDHVGGLIGHNHVVGVQTSYSANTVIGRNNVGGLFGTNTASHTEQPRRSYSTSSVTGEDRVGGLVGNNEGTIVTSYSTGAVTGMTNVGGLAGANTGTITGSFWDLDTSGLAASAGGVGMHTADMKLGANYTSATAANGNVNPDWGSSWFFQDGLTYPFLSGMLRLFSVKPDDAARTYDGQAFSGGNGVTFHNSPSDLTAPVTLDPARYTGTPLYAGTAQGATDAGAYEITVTGGLTAPNQHGYRFTFGLSSTLTIDPAPLTVTADDVTAKTYGDTATLSGFTSMGLVNEETIGSVTLDSDGAAATASVSGNPYSITASAATGGTFNPANYAIIYEDGSLTVAPAVLTYTADPATRAYGDANPPFSGTLTGFVNDETIISAGTGAPFFNSSAGATTGVGAHAIEGAGFDPTSNYTLVQAAANATALILAPAQVNALVNVGAKTYDGTTVATITGRALAGVVDGDDVALTGGTAEFASAAVGAGKTVSVSGLGLGGAAAGNYTLAAATTTTTADITAATVTPIVAVASKSYDGTTAAGITSRSLTGVIGGEDVSLTGGVAEFADASAGSAKTVNVTGLALDGTAAGHYVLSSTSATASADIHALPGSIALTGLTHAYDGAPKPVTVTTNPPGLAVSVTYNGSPAAPSAAGSYAVVATIADPDFTGSASGTLVITAPPPPVVETPPEKVTTPVGGPVTFEVGATGEGGLAYQWQKDGVDLPGETGPMLTLDAVDPGDVGLYSVKITDGNGATTITAAAPLELVFDGRLAGAGTEVGTNIVHPNGNIYDQVQLTGPAASVKAEPGKILRVSYVDLSDDIVQVEFSGAGVMTLTLENPTGPLPPANYNQPGVIYMKGHLTVTITGANETSHLSIFTVGRITAVDQSLFQDGTAYDGFADIALVSITSIDGRFGGVRMGNAGFFQTQGRTGLYAPGVEFTGPVYVHDITAADGATPVLVFGSATDARITGGSLQQPNGVPVEIGGLTGLQFTAGANSHGGLVPVQSNQASFTRDGVEVPINITGL